MLAFILALQVAAAAAQPPAPPVKQVSPVVVTPAPKIAANIDVAGDEESGGHDFVAIWPATAYHTGYDGEVTLSCLVDVHGLAERCRVAAETPQNRGFGKAALELRPTFKLKPATGPDGAPVNATMALHITFKAPKRDVLGMEGSNAAVRSIHDSENLIASQRSMAGNPLAMRDVTMVDDPVWAQAAGFDDLARAYPAKGAGLEGYVAAHCMVERSGGEAGALRSCQVIKESPEGHDFGKAALSLTSKFRIAPAALVRAPHGTPLWVDIPIRLVPPAQAQDRTVMAPLWLAGFDTRTAPRVFPPEAAASGLTTGRGVARCKVGPDGAMSDCVPEPGEPDGLGFSEAAAKLASAMRMNLWSADGAPVQGGVVHIPIRLNLKGAAQ
ncbi:MAG: TonB family protein [Phenylobacterium sp.]|jgi:TonB family protein